MMYSTHVIFAWLLTVLGFKTNSLDISLNLDIIYAFVAVTFGSLLPDIDHPRSLISKSYWFSISKFISKTTRHRGWTHSLFGAILFTSIGAIFLQGNLFILTTFFLGYTSHLLIDTLNPSGVSWLWPKKKKYKIGIIKTGSRAEDVFRTVLLILLVLVFLDLFSTFKATFSVSNPKS
ncbi:MAG: metal-dependent hydrolase [Archaeoglobaceae archaeon]|nr:metal-dependent hydrolase [Archaeoglobaceae archaeon]MCX8152456.1 metal-dependent hydrolase [Archaeoglobaceae archaeon]MDW8013796.1 metal-dependent hydrolase [Archaeoglobaceae archaeon]